MTYHFNNFSIAMTKYQAECCSHQGSCDDDVLWLSKQPKIARQIAKIPSKDISRELKECGTWDDIELDDHDQNIQRILWITANNIKEELHEKQRNKK